MGGRLFPLYVRFSQLNGVIWCLESRKIPCSRPLWRCFFLLFLESSDESYLGLPSIRCTFCFPSSPAACMHCIAALPSISSFSLLAILIFSCPRSRLSWRIRIVVWYLPLTPFSTLPCFTLLYFTLHSHLDYTRLSSLLRE